jgi:nucleoside phosphorylase
MRLLIVDDNIERVHLIRLHLESSGVVDASAVSVASNAQDGRDLVRDEYFDVLLLDIVLPRNAYDANPSAGNSLDLLTEIVEGTGLKKPGYILGLTAYQDVRAEVSVNFERHTWTVLSAEDGSSDWIDKLIGCIKYIEQRLTQSVPREFGIDVLVVTALRSPEMQAVHRLPWNWSAEEPVDDVTFVRRGSYKAGDRSFSVVTSVAPRMGMVSMSLLCGKLIERFCPRIVVMPGICAGVKGRVDLGDVVFAELCWDYQVGKHHVDAANVSAFASEPYAIGADASVSARIEQLALDHAALAGIGAEWHSPVVAPKLVRAPMATGSSVLADSSITKLISAQQRKVAAIEMEMYALYAAAEYSCCPKPLVLGIKSVCDFADNEKHDGHQAYAAYTSAAIMRLFLERFSNEILHV